MDGREVETAYAKLPPLWLAPPAAPVPGSWHVRTIRGEDIVLGSPESLSGRLSRGLGAAWQGQPLRLTADDIAVLYQVPKAP
jgi:hypothetical protein